METGKEGIIETLLFQILINGYKFQRLFLKNDAESLFRADRLVVMLKCFIFLILIMGLLGMCIKILRNL